MSSPVKYRCLGPCHKNVAVTTLNKYRKHDLTKGNECSNSGEFVPAFLIKRGPETEDSDVPVLGRDYVQCSKCHAKPALEADGRIPIHGVPGEDACNASGEIYEGSEECQEPTPSPELTTTPEPLSEPQDGTVPETSSDAIPRIAPHAETNTAPDAARAPASPTTARTPDSTTGVAPTSAAVPVSSVPQTSPVASAATTPNASPTTGCGTPVASAATASPFSQPGSPFSQPAKAPKVITHAQPMTDKGAEIAARLKETFYAYSNRMERSTQATLGPSEIGTPCDRRLALSLMRVAPVNPGGDNWASFVGTCVHAGLAEMFLWADANKGRYAVEVPLTFPSQHVPKGTTDLLDRVLLMSLDHKAQGRWSQDKLKTKGPSPQYRVQVHVYAYGLRLKGEKVDHVAIVSWPRESSNLDDLYVWTEPYDPQIARDAIARVDRIAAEVKASEREDEEGGFGAGDIRTPLQISRMFEVADDCRFCPFHAPGDKNHERGCNGRP